MSLYRVTPQNTSKLPSGIGFIIGNEAAERFSFYGISDFNIWISVGSMVLFLVICVISVSILLKKGYNIKS